MNSNRIDRIKNNENTQAFIMPGHFFSIAFYWLAAGIKTILHTIKMNEVVNQKVLTAVGCSFLIFFITSTRLRQKIIPKIGIPKPPIYTSIKKRISN